VTRWGTSAFMRRATLTICPPTLAHAAAKRDLVAAQRPGDWEPPSILRPPEVLTEAELAAAEAELKALQRHAFEVAESR
jgi:hypothetical protein